MKSTLACLLVLLCAFAGFGQVAVLQIRILEGDGAVHAVGSRASRPLVVEVTDETGRPAAGAAVSFHLPDEGPGGAFTNGLRTEVMQADERGRVTLRGLQANRQPGRFAIRITASLEQARAGTISYQYIADAKGAPASPQTASVAAPAPKGRKWWVVVLIAGAGAAAGGVAARSGGARTASPSAPAVLAPAAVTLPAPPALSIGAPKVTVAQP